MRNYLFIMDYQNIKIGGNGGAARVNLLSILSYLARLRALQVFRSGC